MAVRTPTPHAASRARRKTSSGPQSSMPAALISGLFSQLRSAGVRAEVRAERALLIDFRALGGRQATDDRLQQLQVAATLMLGLAEGSPHETVLILPSSKAGQRMLAVTGILFAAAQLDAALLLPRTRRARRSDRPVLLDNEMFWVLSALSPWSRDASAGDRDLRELMTPEEIDFEGTNLVETVSDDLFLALVNPHRFPSETALEEINGLVRPWLLRREDRWRSDRDELQAIVTVVLEAVENVALHAFRLAPPSARRSLVTLEHRALKGCDELRVRIVDNGCGIPASLAWRYGLDGLDSARAEDMLAGRVNADNSDRLPGGRGAGLPGMRRIAQRLDAELRIDTAGPAGLVHLTCRSGPAQAMSDAIPLPGTTVAFTARFSIQGLTEH
jgi:anti-sigma regulatory factor (Ser/Thr protein kinase)